MQHLEKSLGMRIAMARRNAGLSVRELALRLGVAAQTIGQLEADAHPLAFDLARRLATEFETPVSWLMGVSAKVPLTAIEDRSQAEIESWTERVVNAVLEEGDFLIPPRSPEVSAKLIAYFVAHPDRVFEIEVYEERVRALRARVALQTATTGDAHA